MGDYCAADGCTVGGVGFVRVPVGERTEVGVRDREMKLGNDCSQDVC